MKSIWVEKLTILNLKAALMTSKEHSKNFSR
jgi:hypothetical protein